jgi:predicted amidohydrolase
MVVSPMGSVLLELGHKEEVGVIDIDMSEVDEMRRSIPTFQQKRSDIQFM